MVLGQPFLENFDFSLLIMLIIRPSMLYIHLTSMSHYYNPTGHVRFIYLVDINVSVGTSHNAKQMVLAPTVLNGGSQHR
jgi:hypothetical protein